MSICGDHAGSGMAKPRNIYYQGPKSDHFNGARFFNPDGINPLGFRALLRWRTSDRGEKWPKLYPSPFAGTKPDERVAGPAC
jgi:hypothetical protein